MTRAAVESTLDALAGYSSATRLYELRIPGSADTLLVEAFSSHEQLQELGARDIIVLSPNTRLDLAALLGKPATLEISLADGSRSRFSGLVSEAAKLGSFGGLSRYQLRLTPWFAQLAAVRNSRVWQDKTVIEIVDAVLQDYRPLALWRWSNGVSRAMEEAGPRSYCCQYRETDYDFITRLLTEEGLGWRFEDGEDGLCMVLFANSVDPSATPEDASSAAGAGIRYHAARAGERADTVQSLRSARRLHVTMSTVLSYDYKSKQSLQASVPTKFALGGPHAPALESYDTPGQYFYSGKSQADRYALLQMEAHEARRQLWQLRSTVRTLRPGTRFTLTQGPLKTFCNRDPVYVVLAVRSVGINNLPTPAKDSLAELFGPIPALLDAAVDKGHPENFAAVIAQASASGYANHAEAITADVPWRPVVGSNGLRHHTKPTAQGGQGAMVVGFAESEEICCDRLARVRIHYHWQSETDASCWVRVAQRSAGGGMGSQFLPRIGQEVEVQFAENDIDRPFIVGALYNGQGEGGQVPTPGGTIQRKADPGVFQVADDHRISGQGNLTGGNSPVWHGSSADSAGHRNGASQWGLRSKEFGGYGYNQLLFDDTDGQGRVQLKSSHAASELNLGHLIHAADNYRGSLRGLGAELRTDSYGAVRAGAGLLVSSFGITHGAASRDPAGDNAPGLAHLKQAMLLAKSFSTAAVTHQSVGYAAHLGGDKADRSALDDKAAPLKALYTAAAGMVNPDQLPSARAEAADKATTPADGKLPHTTDAIIAVIAKAGLGVLAGQDLQFVNGETTTLMSGQDTQFIGGGALRVHSGQAVGLVGGVVAPGEQGMGLQLIAAQQAIDLQAQADTLTVQARDEISIMSATEYIDWAAAKSISLSTAGGANITIKGGNITVQCPGKIMVQAGKKSLIGPSKMSYAFPGLPNSICVECLKKSLAAAAAFTSAD